jgi:hypothetical protein
MPDEMLNVDPVTQCHSIDIALSVLEWDMDWHS